MKTKYVNIYCTKSIIYLSYLYLLNLKTYVLILLPRHELITL